MQKNNIYSNKEEPKLMSADELASYLGITRNAAYTLLHSVGFPVVRVGKLLYANRDALKDWLKRNTGGGYYD